MLRAVILAVGLAFALLAPAYAADPQTFKTEDSATKFCKQGNVVWFNPASKIYFDPGSQLRLARAHRVRRVANGYRLERVPATRPPGRC